jgi:NagD protein
MIKAVISDMDGVLYRGKNLIPGAKEFVRRLVENSMPFLFLTNNSEQTPLDLKRKLEHMGIDGVQEENFITSAMVTAEFLKSQKPSATVYIVGGPGLASELYRAGFSVSESRADYVVVGKTSNLTFDMLRKAVRLIDQGAKFIGTNPDVIDPAEDGIEPACGSVLAAIQTATGKKPYIVGKPNPLMMLVAKRRIGCHASETLMIGDRMDTDILGGLEAGMKTALVLSGVSTREVLDEFPYRPDYVFDNVGDIVFEALDK